MSSVRRRRGRSAASQHRGQGPFRFRCCVREDHGKPLFGVAFCHGGEEYNDFVATAGANRLTVYKCLPAGDMQVQQVYCDEDVEESFYTCALNVDPVTGDPLLVAAGTRGILKVINCSTQSLARALIGHGNSVNDVKFHPLDPRLVFSASKDESVRLWNLATGALVCVFAGDGGHRDEVLSLDVHGSGACLASSGMDNTVKIWALDDPLVQAAIERSYTPPRSKPAPPFDTLFVQFPAYSTSRLHVDYVDSVAWWGNLLVSKSTGAKIALWQPDVARGKEAVCLIKEFVIPEPGLWFLRMGVCPSRHLLAVGDREGAISVYALDGDVGTVPSPSEAPSATSGEPVTATRVALPSSLSAIPPQPIPATSRFATMRSAHLSLPIRQVAFHSSGRTLVAVADNATVWRWDDKELPSDASATDAALAEWDDEEEEDEEEEEETGENEEE